MCQINCPSLDYAIKLSYNNSTVSRGTFSARKRQETFHVGERQTQKSPVCVALFSINNIIIFQSDRWMPDNAETSIYRVLFRTPFFRRAAVFAGKIRRFCVCDRRNHERGEQSNKFDRAINENEQKIESNCRSARQFCFLIPKRELKD